MPERTAESLETDAQASPGKPSLPDRPTIMTLPCRTRPESLSLPKRPATLPRPGKIRAKSCRAPRRFRLFSPRKKEPLSALPGSRKTRPRRSYLFSSGRSFPFAFSSRPFAATKNVRREPCPDGPSFRPCLRMRRQAFSLYEEGARPDRTRKTRPPPGRNRQFRAFRYALFTTFCGSPSRKRRMFSSVMATMLRLAPSVIQAMCGVMSE